MGLALSLLYFGIPTLVAAVSFYTVMPALIRGGMLPYYAYSIGLGLPLTGLLVASLVALRLEGYPLTWRALTSRFRLRRMRSRDWAWTLGLFAAQMAVWFGHQLLTSALIRGGLFPIPDLLPDFIDPRNAVDAALYAEATGGLAGNWTFLLTTTAVLAVNILGEEFWWRGVILPRQELAFGERTWWVHGLLWTLFHSFLWWNLLNLLPLCLGLALVVVRRRSNTPGIAMHLLQKADFFYAVLPLFLGL